MAGVAEAMVGLANRYYYGDGVAQDDAEAVRWYRAGAEAREPEAMINLGVMYENGRGVTEDFDEAAALFLDSLLEGDTWLEEEIASRPRETILSLQRILRDEGLYQSVIDGIAGAGTIAAIEAYGRP